MRGWLAFSGFSVGCLLAYLFMWQPRAHSMTTTKGDKQIHLQFKDTLPVQNSAEIEV